MPPQDANPTPSLGGFGIRGPPVQELRLREFNFDHQFDEIEIRQLVAAAILSIHKERGIISPSNLVHPEACAVQVGIPQPDRLNFGTLNRDSFGPTANSFVNRLIQVQILQQDWSGGGSDWFLLNVEMSGSLEMLTTVEGTTTTEVIEALDDDELRSRCETVVLRAGKPDSLLREAATVLEDRLRKLYGSERIDRRPLAAKVLNQTSGKVRFYKDDAEQEDFFHLVRGILGLYGTQIHHRLIDVPSKLAHRVVGIIDEILRVLSRPPVTP